MIKIGHSEAIKRSAGVDMASRTYRWAKGHECATRFYFNIIARGAKISRLERYGGDELAERGCHL